MGSVSKTLMSLFSVFLELVQCCEMFNCFNTYCLIVNISLFFYLMTTEISSFQSEISLRE